jgi:hypothetical protein
MFKKNTSDESLLDSIVQKLNLTRIIKSSVEMWNCCNRFTIISSADIILRNKACETTTR